LQPYRRLSIGISTRGDRRELIDQALLAEQHGYQRVWITEAWGRDAFSVLTEIALNTSRIGLGTGIVNSFSRSPGAIAQAAASLAELLGDRSFVLGLGSSGRQVIEDFHGVPFALADERMRDAVNIIRLALSGAVMTYQGSAISTRGFTLAAPAAAGVRFAVATSTSAMTRVAAEVADAALLIWPTSPEIKRVRDLLTAYALSAARPAPGIVAYLYTGTGDTRSEQVRALRATLAWYVSALGIVYQRMFVRYGFAAEVEAIRRAWSQGRRAEAASLVTDEMLDATALWGTADDIAGRVDALHALGVDEVVLRFPERIDASLVRDQIICLAPEGALPPAKAVSAGDDER
jgi:probable F420-dependent oxidoreductase